MRIAPIGLTIGEMAEQLSICTGETPAFHGRQLRHWAQAGVLATIGPWHLRGEGPTAARVLTTRHLAGAVMLHHFANQRADIEFLGAIARVMRNDSIDQEDDRVWSDDKGALWKKAHDGLAIAIRFAREIVHGGKPMDWKVYLDLHLTRTGTLEAGSFITRVKASPFSIHWVEQRILDASALLPCIFYDADHKLNRLGAAELDENGVAYELVDVAEEL